MQVASLATSSITTCLVNATPPSRSYIKSYIDTLPSVHVRTITQYYTSTGIIAGGRGFVSSGRLPGCCLLEGRSVGRAHGLKARDQVVGSSEMASDGRVRACVTLFHSFFNFRLVRGSSSCVHCPLSNTIHGVASHHNASRGDDLAGNVWCFG